MSAANGTRDTRFEIPSKSMTRFAGGFGVASAFGSAAGVSAGLSATGDAAGFADSSADLEIVTSSLSGGKGCLPSLRSVTA